ncbi:uncharacterized protein LOC134745793 [Cydia strobilella]|uniref:uncharacterized protein LOC134745793 n=1 Tax=Cydia strobilella TaxID=1100964 RepID=UPI003005F547
MKVTVIFFIVAPGLSLQHRHSDSGSSEIDDSRRSQEYDYEQSPYSYRADNKRKQKTRYEVQPGSAELESSNKKYIRHSSKHSRRRSKKHTKDENCDSNEDQPETNHAEQPGLSPGNLVFVPYPYPLMVPPPVPVLPEPTTTIRSSTTSTAPSISYDTRSLSDLRKTEIDKESYLLRNLRHRHELPYVRNDVAWPVRRYLIDRLLSRVRNVKDINSV